MIAKAAKITALGLAFFVVAGVSAYLTLTGIIKSEDTVIVPDLIGKDVVSALEILTDLQLNTKVNGSEYSQYHAKNHVTFQEPAPGSEIKRDRDVRIMISKGAKTILMPNIVALSEQQARMIIEENGFRRGRLSRTYSHRVEKGHVIVQVPQAGAMITRGKKVDILVSFGPKPVKYVMPDLFGQSLDQALVMIESTNLTLGKLRSQFDQQKTRNSVTRQEPFPGYSVPESSPVHLVINRPATKIHGDRLRRPLYGSLLQHRIKNGFLKKRIRVELDTPERTIDIFDDYIKPGDEIWLLVPVDHETTAFIFEDDELVRTRLFEAW